MRRGRHFARRVEIVAERCAKRSLEPLLDGDRLDDRRPKPAAAARQHAAERARLRFEPLRRPVRVRQWPAPVGFRLSRSDMGGFRGERPLMGTLVLFQLSEKIVRERLDRGVAAGPGDQREFGLYPRQFRFENAQRVRFPRAGRSRASPAAHWLRPPDPARRPAPARPRPTRHSPRAPVLAPRSVDRGRRRSRRPARRPRSPVV